MTKKFPDITPELVLDSIKGKIVKSVTQDEPHTLIVEFEEGTVLTVSTLKKERLEWGYGTVEGMSHAPEGW